VHPEGPKAGPALAIKNADLAVNDCALATQVVERLGDKRIAVGPIVAVTGEQFHLPAVDATESAITVKLDFMQPIIAIRRTVHRGCQHRFGRLPGRRLLRTLYFGNGDFLGWPLGTGRGGYGGRSEFVDGEAGNNAERLIVGDNPVRLTLREDVALFDQQPILAVFIAPLELYQHPPTAEFLTVEAELDLPIFILFVGVIHWYPGSPVPNNHRAGAILALGNYILKFDITQRMIFHPHGEAFDFWIKAWAARDCPAFKNAIKFEAEIVVKSRRIVHVHDKPLACARNQPNGIRLRRFCEVTLGLVFCQAFVDAFDSLAYVLRFGWPSQLLSVPGQALAPDNVVTSYAIADAGMAAKKLQRSVAVF
jgi:hypothetical protein